MSTEILPWLDVGAIFKAPHLPIDIEAGSLAPTWLVTSSTLMKFAQGVRVDSGARYGAVYSVRPLRPLMAGMPLLVPGEHMANNELAYFRYTSPTFVDPYNPVRSNV